jgi:hypothetical protein
MATLKGPNPKVPIVPGVPNTTAWHEVLVPNPNIDQDDGGLHLSVSGVSLVLLLAVFVRLLVVFV